MKKNDETLAVSPATAALLKELYTDFKPRPRLEIKWPDFTFIGGPMEQLIRAFGEGVAKLYAHHYWRTLPELSPETSRLLDELYGQKVQS